MKFSQKKCWAGYFSYNKVIFLPMLPRNIVFATSQIQMVASTAYQLMAKIRWIPLPEVLVRGFAGNVIFISVGHNVLVESS